MARVYIIRDEHDDGFAEEVVQSLRADGFRVLPAPDDAAIPGLADTEALEAATHAVVLMSSAAAESAQVKEQFLQAFAPGREILALTLPGQPTLNTLKQDIPWVGQDMASIDGIPVRNRSHAVQRVRQWLDAQAAAQQRASRARSLSYNEIRQRLYQFVLDYKDESSERSESQTFWNDLLACYGVRRRDRANFERHARRATTGRTGRIDVFWPQVFIGEQKSRGQLNLAEDQALDYLNGGDIAQAEMPRYVLSCDFAQIGVLDREAPMGANRIVIDLADLPRRPELLGWLAGYEQQTFGNEEQAAASVKAAQLMGRLYEQLVGDPDADADPEADEAANLDVSILLTRLLFLLFGDDAGLWDRDLFRRFLVERTSEDGTDLGAQLVALFAVLNTPTRRRSPRMDESLARFPYVNGDIFADTINMPFFDSAMRDALLDTCDFDWTAISPAVFGSLFQSIKSRQARRDSGEHYTTEENILKTLRPLFLDDLRAELKAAWNQSHRLHALHDKIGQMQYLDPACGCGNFLVVAYREMRQLELDLLVRLKELERQSAYRALDGTWGLKVTLDQFHGIEINWWPAKIAETAMFLIDHQANLHMAETLGEAPDRLPISVSADIRHANALDTDWATVVTPSKDTFVFGNPPFLGHATRTTEQAGELRVAWQRDDISRLDYVTAWYAKTLNYFRHTDGQWAFVSTNSITQGDPVPRLFKPVFNSGWHIKFAHRTFAWTSEATGSAAVHCVIIGFTRHLTGRPRLFDYADPKGPAHEVAATTINAYLADGPKVFVEKRRRPLAPGLPEATFGNMPRDDGNLLIEPDDYNEVMADPVAAQYVRPFIGARQLIHNEPRWCFWLTNLDPADINRSPLLKQRLDACRQFRSESSAFSTRGMAQTPHLFGQRPPAMTAPYLIIPRHVSENRLYFTVARYSQDVICGDSNFMAPDPDGYLFALISSSMYMTWQRAVGGTLESRLRFSNTIVWNNLPLPAVDQRTRQRIIDAGQKVLDARAVHPERSLADHYNPLAMDPRLVTAHRNLDRIVDRAFGAKRPCTGERERQAILFARYQELTI